MTWLLVSLVVVVLLAGMGYQRLASARDQRRFVAPGSFLDVGGRRLHYTCAGTGAPTVLLEAGIAASSLSWSLVQPRVAGFSRVCSYDRAGLAWSEPGERHRHDGGFHHRTDAYPPLRQFAAVHTCGALLWRAHHPCVHSSPPRRGGWPRLRRPAASGGMERSDGRTAPPAPRRGLSFQSRRTARAHRCRQALLVIAQQRRPFGTAPRQSSVRTDNGCGARTNRRRSPEAACESLAGCSVTLVSSQGVSRNGPAPGRPALMLCQAARQQ